VSTGNRASQRYLSACYTGNNQFRQATTVPPWRICLLHDPEYRRVRQEHLIKAGRTHSSEAEHPSAPVSRMGG
jgi:hypothetical protein